MTNETDRIECAIRHIKTAVDVDPWAVEIAVEAMEKMLAQPVDEDTNVPCKDAISRQAAIDAVIEWYGCEPSDMDYFVKILAKQPSAQPSDEYSKGWHDGRKALREEMWEDGRDRLN